MLRLRKETIVELTATDLVSVAGGGDGDSCVAASCITNPIDLTGRTSQLTMFTIRTGDTR